ncbi:MAG: sterol desaturase family protein [Acidobacteria bacterium]|nr:sterol desaturase family protein [Acidobacteriota bacterium]
MKDRMPPGWLVAPLAVGGLLLLAWLERRRPLRRPVEPKVRREARNLAIAGIGAAAVQLVETPVVRWLTPVVERRRWGLVKLVRMPVWMETALAVLFIDYSMYVWHILMHRIPLFWRFHLAHHTDLDLDASTALRFHFGELFISVPWRAVQILSIGVSPLAFSLWQMLFLLEIMFHHSGVGLPVGVERRLAWIIVTPRIHGIHHSIVREETESNWASVLSIWDRLHRTLRLNVPQREAIIGVPAYPGTGAGHTTADVGAAFRIAASGLEVARKRRASAQRDFGPL